MSTIGLIRRNAVADRGHHPSCHRHIVDCVAMLPFQDNRFTERKVFEDDSTQNEETKKSFVIPPTFYVLNK